MKKKCDICGRETNRIVSLYGYKLCSKHMHQLLNYGKFLDNNPRTNNDLNDYRIIGNDVWFNVYNQRNEKVGEFVIDKEDIEKVKYKKWRYSHNHIITGLPSKGTQKDLSHVILDFNPKDNPGLVVDHISGDANDNRKKNLRICTQGHNVMNKSFMSNNTSGFIGVTYSKKKDRYDPEIRQGNIRCHLGYTKTLEEAVYKRYIAEQLLFGEFANESEQNRKYEFTKNLPQEIKDELYNITINKLKAKNLWQSAM